MSDAGYGDSGLGSNTGATLENFSEHAQAQPVLSYDLVSEKFVKNVGQDQGVEGTSALDYICEGKTDVAAAQNLANYMKEQYEVDVSDCYVDPNSAVA